MDAGPPSVPEPGQAVDVARQARDAEEYEFTGDWFSHNISVWERIFSARAWLDSSNKAVHVLEVGSWEGRSAVWLLTRVCGHGASTLTAIDCWRGAALYGSNAQVMSLTRAGQPDRRALQRRLRPTVPGRRAEVWPGRSQAQLGGGGGALRTQRGRVRRRAQSDQAEGHLAQGAGTLGRRGQQAVRRAPSACPLLVTCMCKT